MTTTDTITLNVRMQTTDIEAAVGLAVEFNAPTWREVQRWRRASWGYQQDPQNDLGTPEVVEVVDLVYVDEVCVSGEWVDGVEWENTPEGNALMREIRAWADTRQGGKTLDEALSEALEAEYQRGFDGDLPYEP